MKAIIALGANLGDREATFQRALLEIGSRVGMQLAVSRFYETEPLVLPGSEEEQPPYLNAVVAVETELSPTAVLEALQGIERDLGRSRATEVVRWGPRIIDLDLVAMEQVQLSLPGLIVPHPEMHNRRFVLEPMAEVEPGWVHPLLKRDVLSLLKALPVSAP